MPCSPVHSAALLCGLAMALRCWRGVGRAADGRGGACARRRIACVGVVGEVSASACLATSSSVFGVVGSCEGVSKSGGLERATQLSK